MTPMMDHCDDCDVCVDDNDHHCVFFSKCIGGGNIKYFYGSIGGMVANFVMVAIFVMFNAAKHGKRLKIKDLEQLENNHSLVENNNGTVEN